MTDDRPTPTNHDGMAVVRSRGLGGQVLTPIRRHDGHGEPACGSIEAEAFAIAITGPLERGLL